jgi:lipopolysaccharide/colanic/teichoic acid biosynthesis glycosyltransferase
LYSSLNGTSPISNLLKGEHQMLETLKAQFATRHQQHQAAVHRVVDPVVDVAVLLVTAPSAAVHACIDVAVETATAEKIEDAIAE